MAPYTCITNYYYYIRSSTDSSQLVTTWHCKPSWNCLYPLAWHFLFVQFPWVYRFLVLSENWEAVSSVDTWSNCSMFICNSTWPAVANLIMCLPRFVTSKFAVWLADIQLIWTDILYLVPSKCPVITVHEIYYSTSKVASQKSCYIYYHDSS